MVTAFPYAVGQVKVINGFRYLSRRGVQTWSLVVAVTFLAPYAYIVIAGQKRIPVGLVYIVIAVLAIVFWDCVSHEDAQPIQGFGYSHLNRV